MEIRALKKSSWLKIFLKIYCAQTVAKSAFPKTHLTGAPENTFLCKVDTNPKLP